jgi:hypothetical protein
MFFHFEQLKSIQPKCFRQQTCNCFIDIKFHPAYYHQDDEVVESIIDWVEEYKELYVKHLNKDVYLQTKNFSTVNANILKYVFDKLHDSLKFFQSSYKKELGDKEYFLQTSDNVSIQVGSFFQLMTEMCSITTQSLVMFTTPNTKISIDNFFDALELFRLTALIFQQVRNQINYKQCIPTTSRNGNINCIDIKTCEK